MTLALTDTIIIVAFFAVTLLIGLWTSRRSGSSAEEYFLSGRSMPWWLLGISMVATTFSADTPNLVADIVRQKGVAGNWAWWAFLLTGMLTVFVYARLWRRSNVNTDLEFYELRYSGKEAAYLRGFRAIYLGVFFNVMIMATVCLAAIKIGDALLGLKDWETVLMVSGITVVYSSLGGFRGVVITDFVQFGLAMLGSVWATLVIIDLPEVGGLESILTHADVADKLSIIPDINDTDLFVTLLIIPLAVQWWSVWYPGAEPGGGGYIAQRMLAAKSETHAVGATLLFNAAHYALRPWPWILIALASIVIIPMRIDPDSFGNKIAVAENAVEILENEVKPADKEELQDGITFYLESNEIENKAPYQRLRDLSETYPQHPEILSLTYIYAQKNSGDGDKPEDPLKAEKLVHLQLANPELPIDKLGQDVAYPSMLSFLPSGLLGLVLASLIAAVMSTLSTHLNWGSSYIVNDFYLRFFNPNASSKTLVNLGRWSTLALMILAALLALQLGSALQAFGILLQIGAGTGLLFILRWFWWRINAWSEITAMAVSFAVAIYFEFFHAGSIEDWEKLLLGIGITTLAWVAVTYLAPATDKSILTSFYKHIRPAGPGWNIIKSQLSKEEREATQSKESLATQILMMLLGTVAIYSTLFSVGFWIYGQGMSSLIAAAVAIGAGVALWFLWKKNASKEA